MRVRRDRPPATKSSSHDRSATGTAGTLKVSALSFRKTRIVVTSIGNLTVHGGVFAGNTTAGQGGAIDVRAPDAGRLTVTGATFTGNTAAADGGAVFDYSLDHAVITGSTFAGNYAGLTGGAIAATPVSEMTLSGDVIRGNTAATGGGIANSSSMSITGTRITGNFAAGRAASAALSAGPRC